MYILITFIHFLFIIGSHFLSFYILEGIFIFLFAFFILYFSPLFFTKEKVNFSKISLDIFSPKKSITLPLIFLYGAIYIFLFALFSSISVMFTISVYTLIGGFLLFFGYMLITDWKNAVFFDVTRIHLVMSYCFIYILLLSSFFTEIIISDKILLLFLITLIFSVFFFSVSHEEYMVFFQAFILLCIFSFYAVWLYFTNESSLGILLAFSAIISIILFEGIPKISFFSHFLIESKITVLSVLLLSNLGLMGMSFFDFTYFPIITIALIYLLSIHTRYCNYISFFVGIISIFFLYGNTFFSLITSDSLFSSLLYVFFLPLCIIGSTYFWEEKFPYDFSMLHYISMGFSSVFSLYILFFVGWGGAFFFLISGIIFLTGVLLLLSFFRFRYN